MSRLSTLHVDDHTIALPIATGTEGERVLDVTTLRAQTGLTTFDPGYVNTASCSSGITFLDGDKGILRYRGIPIEQLAEHSNFLETAYLLMYGSLPTQSEYQRFANTITRHTLLHEDVKRFYDGFPKDAHPTHGDSVGRDRCAFDVLSGQPRPDRSSTSRVIHPPAPCQNPNHRRVFL